MNHACEVPHRSKLANLMEALSNYPLPYSSSLHPSQPLKPHRHLLQPPLQLLNLILQTRDLLILGIV